MYGRGSYGGVGDYYAGDYYAGDPGLFSFLGNVAKGVISGVTGGAIFGPRAPAPPPPVSGIGIMAAGGGQVGASASGQNPGTLGGAVGAFMQQHPWLTAGATALLGAGATAIPRLLAAGGTPLPGQLMAGGTFGVGRRRMHPNKSTYVRRGGGTQMLPPGIVLKGTALVPSRRMNVANPRALRRSLRRVAGFAKLTKRVRRAVSLCASAVGVRRGGKKAVRRR